MFDGFVCFQRTFEKSNDISFLAPPKPPTELNKRKPKSHHADWNEELSFYVTLTVRFSLQEPDKTKCHAERKERKPEKHERPRVWMHSEFAVDDSAVFRGKEFSKKVWPEGVAVVSAFPEAEAGIVKPRKYRLGTGVTTPRKRKSLNIDSRCQPALTFFDWDLRV